ncbi:MAG: pyridoxamine 5'-phosphate oxidase [Chloroflexi bacterium]|nr:pyridoxamine 5'-phosphate oxidase [Chloroflexota bacterium]
MTDHVAHLRRDYRQATLDEADADPDPIAQFDRWFREALAANLTEPNAMTLATASADGAPSARVVLLKGYDAGGFVFFTSHQSQKGLDLAANPRAALVFYWPEIERQVRISGAVNRLTASETDDYFRSRPIGSQLAAWASRQSQVIASRADLEARWQALAADFADRPVPLPPHWGGYRVAPTLVEFWQGRPSRLHDRLRYQPLAAGGWRIERLAP